MINMPERILNIASSNKVSTDGISTHTTPTEYKDKILTNNPPIKKTNIGEVKKQLIMQSATE